MQRRGSIERFEKNTVSEPINQSHGVFKEITKQCTNKDHYQFDRSIGEGNPTKSSTLLEEPTELSTCGSACVPAQVYMYTVSVARTGD